MTDPATQHLYVMQNEHGCIKIGRSVDPWQRRLMLRQTEHCYVELIAAFEGGGEDEEVIHLALDSFRLEGEWFEGTDAARAAIAKVFSQDSLEWRFKHDPDRAAKWLDHLRVVRESNYIRKAIARQIGLLRAASEPSWIHDGAVFWCRYLAETGNAVMISVEKDKKNDCQTVNVWFNPRTKKREVIPSYTSSVDLALLAWPDDFRPISWEGSAIECCIAALVAMKAQLPKVTRPKTEG